MQSVTQYDCEEYVVEMHVSPIKDTVQMTFKVLDDTDSTLSMPILTTNDNTVILRSEVATLITTKREIASMKIPINNTTGSYVLMCGHYIIHVLQVGFGIWVWKWNNVKDVLCENRPTGRIMRTVENRCSCSSTVWLIQRRWRYYDL